MTFKKYVFGCLLIIICSSLFGQNKNDGKLRIIFINFAISKINDSSKLIIYNGEKIISQFNILNLLKKESYNDSLKFFNEYLGAGDYDIIIENLFNKPLLINNLKIKSKVINWLPIDYNIIKEYYSVTKTIIVIDREVLLYKCDKDVFNKKE